MKEKMKDIYWLPSLVLFLIGGYDVLRGFMHTFLLTWSAANLVSSQFCEIRLGNHATRSGIHARRVWHLKFPDGIHLSPHQSQSPRIISLCTDHHSAYLHFGLGRDLVRQRSRTGRLRWKIFHAGLFCHLYRHVHCFPVSEKDPSPDTSEKLDVYKLYFHHHCFYFAISRFPVLVWRQRQAINRR